MTRRRVPDQPGAFSLIELVIVVVILSIVAALAVPRVSRAGSGATATAFVSELRCLAEVAQIQRARSGAWPIDSNTGQRPDELADLLGNRFFGRHTPLGGKWDFERDDNGIGFGVGVVYAGGIPLERLAEVDAIIDDGDLSTGGFRKIASRRYYLVLEN